MSKEKDSEEVGSIKDVRPSFENADEKQAKKEIEQDHDLVSGDIDLDEVDAQRKAEAEEKGESEDDADDDDDDYLDIICRRSKQSGGPCGASKATLVADNSHSTRYRCEECKGVWTVQTGGEFPY